MFHADRKQIPGTLLPQAPFSCPCLPWATVDPQGLSGLTLNLPLSVQKAESCSGHRSSVPTGISWGLWLDSGFHPLLDAAQGDGLGLWVIASMEENLTLCTRGLGWVSGFPLWFCLMQ